VAKRFSELEGGRFVFRSMKEDGDHPSIGPTSRQLGLRTNAGDESDITIDDDGNVLSDEEGLSVTPDHPMRLKLYRRPLEWGGKRSCPPVWGIRIGDLGNELEFGEDPTNPENHGFIVPAHVMTFDRYKRAIEATCNQWGIVVP
jgi:hypothetical protein